MEKRFFTIEHKQFSTLLEKLARTHTVVVPSREADYLWEPFSGAFSFNAYRPVSSIRQFFTPARESLGQCFKETVPARKPFCIVGAKSCDLYSLKVQDYVFLENDPDEYYKKMRDNSFIISGDCTGFKDVCFCLNLDIDPYPEELFDLNIAPLEGMFLVETGSKKGKKLIEDNGILFKEATDAALERRLKNRVHTVNDLAQHLKGQDLAPKGSLYELIKKGYENPVWEEEALRCVECGACIMNCPTCHCFLLTDTEKEGEYFRGRIWDGCQYKRFAQVAGGANPLRLRKERLRNRYIKKFEFFPDNLGQYACTGCGRCIEGCPAKIDLREVFKRLHKKIRTSV